ncbi:MAG: polysaccharide deacetylase family protein, partial [Nitrososphaerales archaeon]
MLLAHRVLEGRNPTESLLIDAGAALSVTDFERRIRFLVGHLRAAAMADYLGGTAGHNSFVLTFDDGYRDNLALALPILRHYRVPMHIFVTTGFVNGQSVPWVDRVARVCSMAANGSCRVAGLDFELPLKRPAGRCIAFDQI